MVLHLSGMCVSHRDTPVPTKDTTSWQPSPSRLQVANLCEDGRAHIIHLFVLKHIGLDVFLLARTNAHLSMWNLPERHERFSVARWHVADLPRRDVNPMALRLSGMCVCHHDTPVHTEDTTSSLRPSTSLRPPSPPRRLPAIDHEDGFTKLCVLIWKSTFRQHVRVNVHASLYCLVGFRTMFVCTLW